MPKKKATEELQTITLHVEGAEIAVPMLWPTPAMPQLAGGLRDELDAGETSEVTIDTRDIHARNEIARLERENAELRATKSAATGGVASRVAAEVTAFQVQRRLAGRHSSAGEERILAEALTIAKLVDAGEVALASTVIERSDVIRRAGRVAVVNEMAAAAAVDQSRHVQLLGEYMSSMLVSLVAGREAIVSGGRLSDPAALGYELTANDLAAAASNAGAAQRIAAVMRQRRKTVEEIRKERT